MYKFVLLSQVVEDSFSVHKGRSCQTRNRVPWREEDDRVFCFLLSEEAWDGKLSYNA